MRPHKTNGSHVNDDGELLKELTAAGLLAFLHDPTDDNWTKHCMIFTNPASS